MSIRAWIHVLALSTFLLQDSFAGESLRGRAEEAGEDAETDAEEEEGAKGPSGSSQLEEKVLNLFNATSKRFSKGRLVLEYDFESRDENLLEDWLPRIDQTKARIHWSTTGESDVAEGYDGYSSSRTREYNGIILSNHGQWLHKAVFVSDVDVTVDALNIAMPRPGTILGPVFQGEKKKRSIGTCDGWQAICLSGEKHAKPPHPKAEKQIPRNVRHTMGFRYRGKVLECYRNEKKTVDTSSVPQLTEDMETGRVGLAWNGSVQCFVFSVTISGRLDPDWVTKTLGEKGKGSKKGG